MKNEKAYFLVDSPERDLISHLDLQILVGGVATKDDLDTFHPFRADPYFRLYYVIDGEVDLLFADGSYALRPGRMYLIPVNQPFRYVSPNNFTHYWVHFCSSQLESVGYFQQLIDCEALPDAEALMRNFVRHAEIGEGVEVLMETDILLRRLLTPFLASMSTDDYERVRNLGPYYHVIDYINRNAAKPLVVTELAAIAGMNYNGFSAGFHCAFGVSPKQYICKRRINMAKTLLLTSDMTIKQISSQVGYDNEFFFYRLFKKYTGQTPKYYRNHNVLG
jgi:AraC-like DNA-binding protein